MSEYCLTWYQWRDLKTCIDNDDMEGIRDIAYAVEMRNVMVKLDEYYRGNRLYNTGG